MAMNWTHKRLGRCTAQQTGTRCLEQTRSFIGAETAPHQHQRVKQQQNPDGSPCAARKPRELRGNKESGPDVPEIAWGALSE